MPKDPEVNPVIKTNETPEAPKDDAAKTPETPKPDKDFDIKAWLEDQPQHVKDALARDSTKRDDSVLSDTLRKERDRANAAEKELKRIEREAKLAEDQKLKDEGKHAERAEKLEKELKEFKAKLEAEEWAKATRAKLKEEDLAEFDDILLASRETPEDVAATGKKLREMIDAKVQAEVRKQLETGKHVRVTQGGVSSKKPSDMTLNEKTQFIADNGMDAWQKAVLAERAA